MDTASLSVNLESSSVKSNIEEISTDISICGNDNIIVFNEDGTIKEMKPNNPNASLKVKKDIVLEAIEKNGLKILKTNKMEPWVSYVVRL